MPEGEGKTPEQNLTRFLLGFVRVQRRRNGVIISKRGDNSAR
jgi:hypothetical protein